MKDVIYTGTAHTRTINPSDVPGEVGSIDEALTWQRGTQAHRVSNAMADWLVSVDPGFHADEDWLASMTKEELVDHANTRGIDGASMSKTKDELIEIIESHKPAEHDEG